MIRQMVILMSFDMQVFTREGEGSAVNHYVLQNIRVLASSSGDSSFREGGHAIAERAQAIRVFSDFS